MFRVAPLRSNVFAFTEAVPFSTSSPTLIVPVAVPFKVSTTTFAPPAILWVPVPDKVRVLAFRVPPAMFATLVVPSPMVTS